MARRRALRHSSRACLSVITAEIAVAKLALQTRPEPRNSPHFKRNRVGMFALITRNFHLGVMKPSHFDGVPLFTIAGASRQIPIARFGKDFMNFADLRRGIFGSLVAFSLAFA